MTLESNNSVLVVDKDRNTALSLAAHFAQSHLDILEAHTAFEGLALAQSQTPRVILSEVVLPDMSGFNLHREILKSKRLSSIPFVYYTGRTDEIDVVVGFELGAADYISKIVCGREVALRISAILKRVDPTVPLNVISVGDLKLDLSKKTASRNRERIPLTSMEFHILAALAQAEGRVLSRKEIVAAAWRGHEEIANRTVDVHIKSMRTKLFDVGFTLFTVRGVGYSLRVTAKDRERSGDSIKNPLNNPSHHPEKQLPSMMHKTVLSRTESGR